MEKHLSLEQLNRAVEGAAQYVLDYAKTEGNGIDPSELSIVRFSVALLKSHLRDLVNEEMREER